MKLYEIMNPSDMVLVSSDDEMVAAIAVLVLGQGKYGMRRCDDDAVVLPIFLLGGADQWLDAKGIDLDTFLPKNALAIAAVFDSAFYGDESEFRALEAALANVTTQAAAISRQKYNDAKRTSMNDIGSRCRMWAARCRELAKGAA